MTAIMTQPFIQNEPDIDHPDDLPVAFPDQEISPGRYFFLIGLSLIVFAQFQEPPIIIIQIPVQAARSVDIRSVFPEFSDVIDRILFP